MVSEAIGTMIINISFFGVGMVMAIIGLIFAITRGMTKNSEIWALTFAAFAWTISLALSHMVFAITIWLFGAAAIIIAYMPLFKELQNNTIYTFGIMFFLINVMLILSSGVFNAAELDNSFTHLETISRAGLSTSNITDAGLVVSGYEGEEGKKAGRYKLSTGFCIPLTSCNPDSSFKWTDALFNPVLVAMGIGSMLPIIGKLMGFALFGPYVVLWSLRDSIGGNPLTIFMSLTVYVILGLVALYLAIRAILGRDRG